MPNLTKDLLINLKKSLQQIFNIRQVFIDNAEQFGLLENQQFISLLQKHALNFIDQLENNDFTNFKSIINTEDNNLKQLKLLQDIKNFIHQTSKLFSQRSSIIQNNNQLFPNTIPELIKSIDLIQNNISHLLNASSRLTTNNNRIFEKNLKELSISFKELLAECNTITKPKLTNTKSAIKPFVFNQKHIKIPNNKLNKRYKPPKHS